jgi:hypothetical protein
MEIAMIIIKKTIEIPADRLLKLELPDSLTPGKAELTLEITPEPKPNGKAIMAHFGCLKGTTAFGEDSVEFQRKIRDEW